MINRPLRFRLISNHLVSTRTIYQKLEIHQKTGGTRVSKSI